MRRWRRLSALLVTAGAVYLYLAALHPPQRVLDHPYFAAPGPWVVAHRGGMGLAPENTLEAFRGAEALGVDVLEMDLRVTADGALAVIHDDTVGRTTNGRGRIGDMRLSEIQALDAGHRFVDGSGRFPLRGVGIRVPSLTEVLGAFPETRLNVEMKEFTPDKARVLCDLLRRHQHLDRVLVSAFDHAPMEAFREVCPEVATGATRREVVAFYYLNRILLGRLFRSPAATMQVPLRFHGRTVVTRRLLQAARRSNRPVQAWTVNDEADMKRLLETEIQAILTDRPDRLLALLGRPHARPETGSE